MGDAPGPAGFFRLNSNEIRDNTKACPATEEAPALSGVGLALLAATNNAVNGNLIAGNVPSGDTVASGGVVVASGFGGTPPRDNKVRGNRILGNNPDISWDQTGSGNTFQGNNCSASDPAGLCH